MSNRRAKQAVAHENRRKHAEMAFDLGFSREFHGVQIRHRRNAIGNL
jgi:hypothetical protein